MGTSTLLSLAGVGIPLLLLFPTALSMQPLTFAIGVLASLGGGGITHATLRYRREQEAREAESDLLNFLCLCYANRCERFEDLQREMLLGPLRRRVYRMLLWLEGREEFITNVRDLLKTVAQEAESNLFDSSFALFTIFVANGSQ